MLNRTLDCLAALAFVAALAIACASPIPCDTDTDCMIKNGGDGGPYPAAYRRALDCPHYDCGEE